MTESDFYPVVWVSLASVSGLSLISLGQPGLRTDLDEQVYTGGLTAVQAMLGGEIGGDTERFVGGSDINKTGRFIVRNDKGGELVGQFLLISQKNIAVARDLVEYYEQLVTIFAEETLQTEVYERVEREFRALGVNDVLDLFFESIKKARKRKSLPMDKQHFFSALTEVARKSINDYEYSATLVKISEFKGKYQDLTPRMKTERKDLIAELSQDVLEFLTSEHPHALVLFPKIDSLQKDFLKHLNSEIENILKQEKVTEALEEIIADFEKNDLKNVLEEFALEEVTKANLYARLENEIFSKFRREFPLLLLVDPEIKGFPRAIEVLTTRINEEYDVAGTLSRIGYDMLKGYEKEEELMIPYIRNFCEQFPTGLTLTAWKYMQIIFKLITLKTKIDVKDVLPSLKDQIPDSHFSTVQKMVTKYKLAKLDPLSFSVKRATDILPFYRALLASLGFGVNTLICEVALGSENPKNFLRHTANNFNEFSSQIHQVFAIFSIFSYVEKMQSRLEFSPVFPKLESFGGAIDVNALDVPTLIEKFIVVNTEGLRKEGQLVQNRLDELEKAFSNRVQDIERFLTRNPIDISKGYSLDFKEVEMLSFTTKPAKSIEEILQKAQSEYKKILENVLPDLDEVKDAAQQFLDGKIAENKLESILSDRKYLNKVQGNYRKNFNKIRESIIKKYNELQSSVEKRFNGFQKDFSKQYTQACSFLNINRKALSKGDKQLYSDPTSIINGIQSSIDQIIRKDPAFSRENLGSYYFYAKNRSLPSSLKFEISNSLVHNKKYPYLKEAIEALKVSPRTDVYQSYAEVLEIQAKDSLSEIFREAGKIIGRNYLKANPDVFFVERDKIPVPTLEMGVLTNVDAMDSLRSLFGSSIVVESEEQDETSFFHVSAIVPDLSCNLKKLKKIWKKKEWNLRKVFLVLSFQSLLEANDFYINLLQFSSGLYSVRVKESLEEIFQQIEKEIAAG
ncbi:MAG: hypothetical protein JSV04_09625 [Candidatus Heimdallarchaeota archaeon]|nr:MAG: hypothetical protein JSV04_09625 [Candidatus Heimdallarchaeota archaeon]